MSVHLSVIELRKIYTFVKLQCILIMLNISLILCYIMLLGIILHMSFDFGNYFDYLPKFTKISFLFISMGSSFWFGIIWYYVILCTQF